MVPLAHAGFARDRMRLTDPFVMWLVDVLVDTGVMLQAMNPVDTDIVEGHVQHHGHHQPGVAILSYIGIEQALATNLG